MEKSANISCVLDLSSPAHLELMAKLLNVGKGEEKEDKKEAENQNESEMKHPKEAICYSFSLDPTSPSYLKIQDKIFNVDFAKDVVYFPKNFTETSTDYSDCENTASMKVAAEFGIDADLHEVFSSSASMKIGQNSDENIKTVRLDAKCLACIGLVTPIKDFNTFPHSKLNETFCKAVKLLKCEDGEEEGIEDEASKVPMPSDKAGDPEKTVEKSLTCDEFASRVGIFYATDIHLGGKVRKSYIMQATKEDNEFSVKADIEAKFGVGSWGNGNTSSNLDRMTNEAESSIKIEWRVQGGNTAKLLGLTSLSENGADANNLIKEWAKTVDLSNARPIGMTLKPIWELVEAVAPGTGKGKHLREHLLHKWKKAAEAFNPTLFLSEQIFDYSNLKTKIFEKIKEHKKFLEAQKFQSQNMINSWHAFLNIKGNIDWRDACIDGIQVMDEVIKKIKESEKIETREVFMTAKDFRCFLMAKRKKFEEQREVLLGCCGRTSSQPNRIIQRNISCIDELLQLCSYKGLWSTVKL